MTYNLNNFSEDYRAVRDALMTTGYGKELAEGALARIADYVDDQRNAICHLLGKPYGCAYNLDDERLNRATDAPVD